LRSAAHLKRRSFISCYEPDDGPEQTKRNKFQGRHIENKMAHEIASRSIIQVFEGRRVLEHLTVEENLKAGRIVMAGPAEKVRKNPGIKEFYLGLGELGSRKSYKNVKH
jgi:ABC-type branched-subunit amino acid transport system ATPase component